MAELFSDVRGADRTTGIEWAQHTWNPVVGCSVMSAGCANCYAMKQAWRIQSFGTSASYVGLVRKVNDKPVWTGKVSRASDSAMRFPLAKKSPAVIFVNSMSDLFHEDMEEAWQREVFEIIQKADWHQYQILTKRPDVAMQFFVRNPEFSNLPQVWLGTSVERADVAHRIDQLRRIPALTRFLSVEPVIGRVGPIDLTGIHWVITGGESGPGRRPCDPAWIMEVRAQCEHYGVPLFHKQWGDWQDNPLVRNEGMSVADAKTRDPDPKSKGGAYLAGGLCREFPAGRSTVKG